MIIPKCSLSSRDTVVKFHNKFTDFCECYNEYLKNGSHFLWQYHKTSSGIFLSCPIQYVLARMIALTLYIESTVLFLFLKIPNWLFWLLIVTMQKWFKISNVMIQDDSVAYRCSTIVGGLCIIAIIISHIWDQTWVNHQFHFIYYYYERSMIPTIK